MCACLEGLRTGLLGSTRLHCCRRVPSLVSRKCLYSACLAATGHNPEDQTPGMEFGVLCCKVKLSLQSQCDPVGSVIRTFDSKPKGLHSSAKFGPELLCHFDWVEVFHLPSLAPKSAHCRWISAVFTLERFSSLQTQLTVELPSLHRAISV